MAALYRITKVSQNATSNPSWSTKIYLRISTSRMKPRKTPRILLQPSKIMSIKFLKLLSAQDGKMLCRIKDLRLTLSTNNKRVIMNKQPRRWATITSWLKKIRLIICNSIPGIRRRWDMLLRFFKLGPTRSPDRKIAIMDASRDPLDLKTVTSAKVWGIIPKSLKRKLATKSLKLLNTRVRISLLMKIRFQRTTIFLKRVILSRTSMLAPRACLITILIRATTPATNPVKICIRSLTMWALALPITVIRKVPIALITSRLRIRSVQRKCLIRDLKVSSHWLTRILNQDQKAEQRMLSSLDRQNMPSHSLKSLILIQRKPGISQSRNLQWNIWSKFHLRSWFRPKRTKMKVLSR